MKSIGYRIKSIDPLQIQFNAILNFGHDKQLGEGEHLRLAAVYSDRLRRAFPHAGVAEGVFLHDGLAEGLPHLVRSRAVVVLTVHIIEPHRRPREFCQTGFSARARPFRAAPDNIPIRSNFSKFTSTMQGGGLLPYFMSAEPLVWL